MGQKSLAFVQGSESLQVLPRANKYWPLPSPGVGLEEPAFLLLGLCNPAEEKHTLPSETDATEKANRGPEESF